MIPIPPNAATLLLQYWKVGLFAILIAIIGYQNLSTYRWVFGLDTIPALESKLEETRKQYETLKGQFDQVVDANKNLADAQDLLNKQIMEWKQVSEHLEKQNEKLARELADMRRQTDATVDSILKGKAPKTCTEAIQYLIDGKDDLRW